MRLLCYMVILTEEALLKSSKQKKIGVMGGLVCRGRQQFHFHPFSPKKQASDWLAPQEANVNNNNSLEAPIRGLLFGGKLEERNCHHPAPHQTSNHAQLVQRKSRMVLYSKASSGKTQLDLIRLRMWVNVDAKHRAFVYSRRATPLLS